MEFKATQKYLIASPKKLREVVPLVKNLSPIRAFDVLPFVHKRAAESLKKVVGTALANARQKGVSDDNLYFKEIQINEGPRLKRWRAGARGMAKPYVRKISHIKVVLGVREKSASDVKPALFPNKNKTNVDKVAGSKNVGGEQTHKRQKEDKKSVNVKKEDRKK